MNKTLKSLLVAAGLTLGAAIAAYAANTVFFTSIGDQTFPFKAPLKDGTPGSIDNMTIGATTPAPLKVTTLNASDQISSSAGTPTIASGACGATTNGAVVAGSTNQSGKITIGASATTTCTVAFSKTLGAAPKACVIGPAATGSLADAANPWVSSVTSAQFVVSGTALANTAYYYFCF